MKISYEICSEVVIHISSSSRMTIPECPGGSFPANGYGSCGSERKSRTAPKLHCAATKLESVEARLTPVPIDEDSFLTTSFEDASVVL